MNQSLRTVKLVPMSPNHGLLYTLQRTDVSLGVLEDAGFGFVNQLFNGYNIPNPVFRCPEGLQYAIH